MPDVEIVTLSITGNRLKLFLKKRKMSQEECARRARISTRTMTRVIKGPRPPLLEVALRLATVLNAKVEEIFIISKTTRRA